MNILKAREGYKLYNGSVIALEVALARNANASDWKEITQAEAEAIEQKEQEERERREAEEA